jgi:hypothetical protein
MRRTLTKLTMPYAFSRYIRCCISFNRRNATEPMLLKLRFLVLVLLATACSLQAAQANTQVNAEPVVNVTEDLIETAVLSEGVIWLKLTHAGQNKLASISRAQPGNRISINVLGYHALSLVVVHEIDSRRLVIDNPSPELEAALEPYFVDWR